MIERRITTRRIQRLRFVRCHWFVGMILVTSMHGCAPMEKQVGETITTRIRDPFLRQHITTEIKKGAFNPQTGLYEVDSAVGADRLDASRPNSYRVMVRVIYYQGQVPQPVDTSQWSEIILQPGHPVSFSSTSLTSADHCLLEVAYPEEVGLR